MLVTLRGLKSFDHHSLISACKNKVFDENTKKVHFTLILDHKTVVFKKPKWSCTWELLKDGFHLNQNTVLTSLAGAG